MTEEAEALLVAGGTTDEQADISRWLSESGYRISTVATREECLDLVGTKSAPLLILIDEDPSSDLVEFVGEIKRRDEMMPVLVLAPEDDPGVIVELLRGGVDDHLPLPVGDPALFLCTVERDLDLRRRFVRMRDMEAELREKYRNLVQNMRDLERDQRTGLQVQRSMMPDSPFRAGGVTFAHHVIPSLILSGDFIDYFELSDGRLLFYIADVSGHGSSSAFVTVLLKNLSRRLAREFDSLELDNTAEVLRWLNQEIVESSLDKHVTMFLGIVDQQSESLEYSNAAHFPGAILSSGERTEYLEVGGLPLGLYDSVDYEVRSLRLPRDFTLVLLSDGVFEVMDQETLKAKEDRLLELVAGGDSDIDSLVSALGLDQVNEVPDDIALFTVSGAAV